MCMLVDVATLQEVPPFDGQRTWVEYVAFSTEWQSLAERAARRA